MNAGRSTEIEELLPWYLNGTLEEPERQAVESALAEDPELRRRLEESRALGDLFAQARPGTSALVAFAAGELAGVERDRVAAWLEEDARDRELVELARRSLSVGPGRLAGEAAGPAAAVRVRDSGFTIASEAGASRGAGTPGGVWRGWPVLAAAAALLGAVGLAGWVAARAELARAREAGLLRPATPIPVVELAPDEAQRGGVGVAVTPVPTAGLVAVVLVVDRAESWERTVVELRDVGGGVVGAQEVSVSDDGVVTLLLDLERAAGPVERLVLIGERDGERVELHGYRLAR